ncbi:MAG TPA: hypothetical protein VMT11_14195 [Myxococcaceae bacterium]|nr:hypothetical protein [Myxococcaceae bacterium]
MTSTSASTPRGASNRTAAGYLVAQALAVLVWWVLVFGSAPVRAWFFPYGGLDPAFTAFVVPDLVFIVGGSVVVARQRLRGKAGARASGILLGAVGYATLYTLGWTVVLQAPVPGAIAMLVISTGTWLACR